MPTSHAYAERLRARLPRALQEGREAAGLSRYALEKKCGVSREMIGCIESGDSILTFHLGARLAYGMGMTLAAFVGKLATARGGDSTGGGTLGMAVGVPPTQGALQATAGKSGELTNALRRSDIRLGAN